MPLPPPPEIEMPPKLGKNPLLAQRIDKVVDVDRLETSTVFTRKRHPYRRQLRDQRRLESAAEAIAGFDRDLTIYGFTKGQFSLIQLITEALKITGPGDLVVSTWTAGRQDVAEVLAFCRAGMVTSARWLVDLTFTKRAPEIATQIRRIFGDDAIRVAKNHAKFALIGNDAWKVSIHTSMNLNHNPRFENFEITHDPELYDFHEGIIQEIWRKQARTVDGMRCYEIEKHFRDSL